MIRTSIIREKYSITQPFASVASIRKTLATEPFLVIEDEGKYEGILTPGDIALRPHIFVADCATKKPRVTHDIGLREALDKMNEESVTAIAAFEGNKFKGVILHSDLDKEVRRQNQEFKISDHKQLEKLKELTLELKKTKMSDGSIRGFSSMTHDIRNAIAIIHSASYLAKNAKNKADGDQFLERINESCQFAVAMLNRQGDMLVDDQKEDKSTLIEINNLIIKEVNVFQSTALVKDIAIKFKPTNEKLYTLFPLLKLQRIIANLLSNALKFTNRGGYITVSTYNDYKKIHFEIQDTGIGIPDDLKTLIFESNTKARRAGTEGESTTGMGLSMVKDAIESYGGEIVLNSVENSGTTFRISLLEAQTN